MKEITSEWFMGDCEERYERHSARETEHEWFMGDCEECYEHHSVRETEHGTFCWVCVSNPLWRVMHVAKPFRSVNL